MSRWPEVTGLPTDPADGDRLVHDRAATMKSQFWGVDTGGVLAIVGAVIAPSVLITSLLYYFGWARTQAAFAYFGLDASLVEYSTPDFVLRSVNIAFEPLIRAVSIALALLVFHRLVVLRALDMPKESRARRGIQLFVVIAHVVGVSLAAVVITDVILALDISRSLGLAVPLLLIASVALIGYVTYLRLAHPDALTQTCRCSPAPAADQDVENRGDQVTSLQPDDQLDTDVDEPRRSRRLLRALKRLPDILPSPRVNPHPRAQVLVLLALGLLGVIWGVSLYAGQVGTAVATGLVADLPNRSAIVIYSTERIAIAGAGVNVDEIGQPGSKYHYQYSGLRLLVRSADKYLLLPVGWQRGRDRVFIIRDDEYIRIDVTAPRS